MVDNRNEKKRTDGMEKVPYVLIMFFTAISFFIILSGYFYYSHYKKIVKANVQRELMSIATLKMNQIVEWRAENIKDSKFMLNNMLIKDEMHNLIIDPDDQRAKKDIFSWMTLTRDIFGYKEIGLFDLSGRIIYSTDKDINQHNSHMAMAIQSLQKRDILMGDINRETASGEVDIDIFIPILISNGKGKQAIGGMMVVIDPGAFLYPLIQQWPVPSNTAETLLIRQDGDYFLYLNELRHRKNTALSLRVPIQNRYGALPDNFKITEGFAEGEDYRNIPVLSALLSVPDTGWYIVAKIDLAEAYLPAREIFPIIFGLVIVSILSVALGMSLHWRHQKARYYKELYKVEETERLIEEKYRNLFRNSSLGIYHSTYDGKFIDLNPALARMLGYDSPEEAMRSINNIAEQIYADPSERAAILEKVLKTGEFITSENTLLRRDGTLWNGKLNLHFVNDSQGASGHLEGFIEDITERVRLEEEARENASSFIALFKNMNEGVAMHEMIYDEKGVPADYRIISVNSSFTRFTGISEEKAVAALASELYGTDSAPYLTEYNSVIESGEPLSFETYFPPMKKYFSISVVSPRPGHFATIFIDITGRKIMEESLRLNEQRLESLLKLTLMKFSAEKDIMSFALEEAVRLTKSTGGYLHFFNEDEQTIQIQLWSEDVMRTCAATGDDHYPINKAGIWADSVRLRRPVIHNDYQNMPGKKGYPEGHFNLIRHLGVPIFDSEHLVGISGVGNKEEPYNEIDANQVSLFMNSMWKIVQQRKNDEERKALVRELREALDNVRTLSDMLPICSSCKKIRDDKGYWKQVEVYISENTDTLFSHSICPECAEKTIVELSKMKNEKIQDT